VTAYDAGRARYVLLSALALAGATPEQADAVVSRWEARAGCAAGRGTPDRADHLGLAGGVLDGLQPHARLGVADPPALLQSIGFGEG